jgi:Zn-dependent protease
MILMGPPFIIAIVLHEIAHGYVASKLGDPTAKALGRITFNPLKHVDPFLSVILPGILILSHSPIIFGGAKPIPVNPGYFKNPRRDMAIVAVAGPVTNFILAGMCFYLYSFLIEIKTSSFYLNIAEIWLVYSILINVVLGLFNLIPVPPLDGGRIAVGLLPLTLARSWAKLERYGLLIVLLLLYFDIPNIVLDPAIDFVSKEIAEKMQNIDNSVIPEGYYKKNLRSSELELT